MLLGAQGRVQAGQQPDDRARPAGRPDDARVEQRGPVLVDRDRDGGEQAPSRPRPGRRTAPARSTRPGTGRRCAAAGRPAPGAARSRPTARAPPTSVVLAIPTAPTKARSRPGPGTRCSGWPSPSAAAGSGWPGPTPSAACGLPGRSAIGTCSATTWAAPSRVWISICAMLEASPGWPHSPARCSPARHAEVQLRQPRVAGQDADHRERLPVDEDGRSLARLEMPSWDAAAAPSTATCSRRRLVELVEQHARVQLRPAGLSASPGWPP